MKLSALALILILSITGIANALNQGPGQPNDWTRYTPEKCGLSLELPGEPEQVNAPIPEDISQQVHYMKLYLYKGDELAVIISHTSAKIPVPAKSVAEGVVKGIIKSPGVSDLNYSTEPSTETKSPIKGSYKQSGVVLEMSGVAFSQEKQAWLVALIYNQTSRTAQSAAQRILSSIKIDGMPCPERKETVGENRVYTQEGQLITITR